tara:strand:- start:1204 stop:1365 length:162 start_codon:yes stop_codon:yes gene_type:complete
MIGFLLYADLKCTDAVDIINRVKAHDKMNNIVKQEVILTIEESTPHCPWDAND